MLSSTQKEYLSKLTPGCQKIIERINPEKQGEVLDGLEIMSPASDFTEETLKLTIEAVFNIKLEAKQAVAQDGGGPFDVDMLSASHSTKRPVMDENDHNEGGARKKSKTSSQVSLFTSEQGTFVASFNPECQTIIRSLNPEDKMKALEVIKNTRIQPKDFAKEVLIQIVEAACKIKINVKTNDSYKIGDETYIVEKELASKKIAGDKCEAIRNVLLCREVRSNDLFVLKIHNGLHQLETAIPASIEKEIKINTKLGLHINFLNTMVEKGQFITVEKFQPGKNFITILEEDNKKTQSEFPLSRKIEIAIKIIEALEMLHANEILHIDFKLDNILYHQEDGKVSLIDFELALITDNNLKALADGNKFTPSLVPPEFNKMFKDDKNVWVWECSNKTDIWLLGNALSEWFGIANELSNTPRALNSIFKTNVQEKDDHRIYLNKIKTILEEIINEQIVPENRPSLIDIKTKLQDVKHLLSEQVQNNLSTQEVEVDSATQFSFHHKK